MSRLPGRLIRWSWLPAIMLLMTRIKKLKQTLDQGIGVRAGIEY